MRKPRRNDVTIWRCIATLSWATTATAVEVKLPAETAVYVPSALPGYALIQQHCIACHSADYVSSQPPDSTREYWQHTVEKMQHAFGAPIPDRDITPMVDYLAKTYGGEARPAPVPERDDASASRSGGRQNPPPAK